MKGSKAGRHNSNAWADLRHVITSIQTTTPKRGGAQFVPNVPPFRDMEPLPTEPGDRTSTHRATGLRPHPDPAFATHLFRKLSQKLLSPGGSSGASSLTLSQGEQGEPKDNEIPQRRTNKTTKRGGGTSETTLVRSIRRFNAVWHDK